MIRPLFRHFGGKWSLSGRVEAPRYPVIIEPFAGAAGYSLRHGAGRTVRLYDLSPAVCLLWDYLLGASQEEILALPVEPFHEGADVRTLGLVEAPMRLIQRWLTPQGSTTHYWMPPSRRSCVGTAPGSTWTTTTRQRIADALPLLSGWSITQASYDAASTDEPATWHVDPPYQRNARATAAYGTPPLDYAALGAWCRRLPGQVMAHEQHGADWLPFVTLDAEAMGGRASEAEGRASQHEVWWVSGATQRSLFP